MAATPAPPLAARLDSTGHKQYDQADQVHSYSHDLGTVVLPQAKREPGHKVIRLHGGVGYRRVEWAYTKRGAPPVLPAEQNTSGDTLIASVVSPVCPTPDPLGGGYVWTVTGVYEYVQDSPRRAGYNAFPVGTHPFPVLPMQNIAGGLASQYLSDYSANGFDSFMNKVADSVTFLDSTAWPFLGIPPVFSTTLTIQD